MRVREVREGFLEEVVQAYLTDIVDSIPDHPNKGNYNLFIAGGSCLQFVKIGASVKHNKVTPNKTRCTCT